MNNFCQKLALKLQTNPIRLENQEDYHASSVLVPLVLRNGRWHILFEVRSKQLKWQPGEVCFPGGRIEKQDKNPSFTAVRETCEELGLRKDDVRVLGGLNYIVSQIGVMVYPYVGILKSFEEVQASREEVSEIFTVPIRTLLSMQPLKAKMEVATRPLPGFPYEIVPQYTGEWLKRATYPVYFYTYQQHTIWGITARVLQRFLTIYDSIENS